jgi:hypothetical protein
MKSSAVKESKITYQPGKDMNYAKGATRKIIANQGLLKTRRRKARTLILVERIYTCGVTGGLANPAGMP